MTIDRAINIQQNKTQSIKDLFSRARACHLQHIEIVNGFSKIMDTLPTKTPRWVREYLRGRFETALEFHRELFTEFCYRVDNKWYTTHKESKRTRLTDHHTVVKYNLEGHSVYKDSDKIYF